MRSDYGKTSSIWMRQEHVHSLPSLNTDLETDVCVVGGGLAGPACVYRLLREGRAVVVVEAGVAAGAATSRTTAHLASVLDDRFYELDRWFGEHGSRLAYESPARAIELIED